MRSQSQDGREGGREEEKKERREEGRKEGRKEGRIPLYKDEKFIFMPSSIN